MKVRSVLALAACGLLLTACAQDVPPAAGVVPPTGPVGDRPTFVACGRDPADPTTTNLRPSELTEADRQATQAWPYGPIPDGRMVVEHAADLPLTAGLLGFGNGYEASVGLLGGEQLHEVAEPGTTAPVTLAVLDSPSSGRRVAFLEVRVAPGEPVRWQEEPGLGFGTDGGDGGVWAPGSREEEPADDAAAFDAIDAMYPGGDSTSGNVCTVRSTPDGVDGVVFSAGYGDGGYPTFVGYDVADEIVSVVSYGFVIPWALSGLPGTPPPPSPEGSL